VETGRACETLQRTLDWIVGGNRSTHSIAAAREVAVVVLRNRGGDRERVATDYLRVKQRDLLGLLLTLQVAV